MEFEPYLYRHGIHVLLGMGTGFPRSKKEKVIAADLGVKKELFWVWRDGTVDKICATPLLEPKLSSLASAWKPDVVAVTPACGEVGVEGTETETPGVW